MAARNKPNKRQTNWSELGLRAAQAGDYAKARALFENALEAEPRNASHHHNFAVVLERLGEFDAAAAHLTMALARKPRLREAGARLAQLTARRPVLSVEQIDAAGLSTALGFEGIPHQALAKLGFQVLENATAWGEVVDKVANDPRATAASLVTKRTASILTNALLLRSLELGINVSPDSERVIAAIRRSILLDLPRERFRDNALTTFTLALAAQFTNNEHVHAVGDDERLALEALSLDPEALVEGDANEGIKLLLLLLYRPLDELLGDRLADLELDNVRPRAVRSFAVAQRDELLDIAAVAKTVKNFGTISDATSKRVASQYEERPYPRWKTLDTPKTGALRGALGRYFEVRDLAFFDQPFDVLIAGAGTGQHVCRSAIGYGENAQLLAIDLSSASLGYAARMVRRHSIANIELIQADVLEIGAMGRSFDIIESVGVLHHMDDPSAGWRSLLGCLKPGGLMLVGLYSRTSRRNIIELRDEADYPGPACTDDLARQYRDQMLARPEPEAGEADLRRSVDFYSLSGFRDLVLHQSEVQFTIPEISDLLDENGLEFRGFAAQPHVLELFADAYPDDPWPGLLENWQAFEEANPRAFDDMYQFWCQKTV